MIEHLCDCGRTYRRFNSLQRKCPICYYNTDKKPQKPLKRMGKQALLWQDTRREWIASNPEPWFCIVGNSQLDMKTMQLDHDLPRSKRPDLRHDFGNLNTMCGFHNRDKASRTLEDYLNSNPDMTCKRY